jgi:hypothetical protein
MRRQSEAATALFLFSSVLADSKAASRFACRRTPYIPKRMLSVLFQKGY